MTAFEKMVDKRPRWRRRLSRAVHDPYGILMERLDDSPDGLSGPPTAWRSWKVRGSGNPSRTIQLRMDNDAFEVLAWFRYDDELPGHDPRVAFSLSRSEAHALTWSLIRWWLAEWGGLRRRLWYWALRKHLDVVAPDRHIARKAA